MARVESFELDHNTVKAPHVHLAGTKQNGDALVEKYDLRFPQPNKDALPAGALHALEHLLAANMCNELRRTIDIPSMGCCIGFYTIMWGQHSPQEIRDAPANVLGKVISTEVVPVVSAKECGNYKDHSLFATKEYVKIVLDQGISLDPSERIL